MHSHQSHTLTPAARFGYGLSLLLLAVLAFGLLLTGFSAPATNSDSGYFSDSNQALVASQQGSRLRVVAPAPVSGDDSAAPPALLSLVSLLLPPVGSQVVIFPPVTGHVAHHHPSFWPILRAPPLA